ncbi:ECF transporter S component, partial [bacterium]|nr:ECF transporter S component [bacterium]
IRGTVTERTRPGSPERHAIRPRNGLKLARMALFTALGAALGYALSGVPNVELVTATVFIAGAVLGPREGALVGAAAEALYTSFHPMGAPAPPLWVAQVLGMSLAGMAGGFWRRFPAQSFIRSRYGAAAAGLLCAITFDLLTTASFAFFMHFNLEQIIRSFIFGLWFTFLHAAANTLIFALLVPAVLARLAAIENVPGSKQTGECS